MSSSLHRLLCHYRYDPLDRLINQAQADIPVRQRYYCKNRLVSEIQEALSFTIFQYGELLLAERQSESDSGETVLLATNHLRSVLNRLKVNDQRDTIAYAPYGHQSVESGLSSLLGFNGERRDPVTGHYLLGNGYRAFNPVIMRFNSPDSLSPFGKGGLNAYAYCAADPINRYDPSGHVSPLVQDIALKWLYKTQTRSIARPDSFTVWRNARAPQPKLLLDNPVFQGISKYLGHADMDNLTLVSKKTRELAGAASDGNLRARITGMRKEKVPINHWLKSDYLPQSRKELYIPKASGIGSASFKKLGPTINDSKSMAQHIQEVRRDAVSDLSTPRREGRNFYGPKLDDAFWSRAEDLLAERLLESLRK
ncbi:RHS repeat-associated core domain-containing protein|uniref:RHS repeat-associated core domain-containing protein n=1 Tax=Pseudomonas sp. SbOxS1 TaxID=2723884 RepID=UPI0015D2170A|nr:RHS repeat-associated core domain-containing protein [Pseudomonas sp. SbOxS1]NYU06366.1 RHS repeat-associated core domain-containing protein [Pseudomonas sp. SbOxS1]